VVIMRRLLTTVCEMVGMTLIGSAVAVAINGRVTVVALMLSGVGCLVVGVSEARQ
jgi:hypothetical protein